MKRNNKPPVNGRQLLADFQTAAVAIATSRAATFEAERSESTLLQQLGYWSRDGYLNPGTIDTTEQYDVSRASLDAHIKKVQAQQVDQLKSVQLTELLNQTSLYRGKRVRVSVLDDTTEPPIDVLWFNPRAGYRSNVLKKRQLSGTIEEVLLDKNMIIIRPRYLLRLLNKELAAYVIYVINPNTLQPMVDLTFV